MNLEEKRVDTKRVFEGNLLKVNCDTVELPNGNLKTREYFQHPGAACIVALTEDMQIIMESQFRYPFHTLITEIPAGKLDPNEDPLVAAKRELQEETGYTAKKWTYLGDFYPSVAYTDENIRMYLAQELEQGARNLDDDEFLNVQYAPFKNIVNDVMDGKIKDGKSQAAILKAYKHLKDSGQV